MVLNYEEQCWSLLMPLPSSLSLIFFDQNFLRRLLPSSICSPLLSSHQLSKRSASLKLTNVFKEGEKENCFLGLSPTLVSPDYTGKSALFVVSEYSQILVKRLTWVFPDKTKWHWKIPIYNLPFSNSPFWEEGYGVHSGANMCRDIGWQSRYCFNSQYLNWKRPRPPPFHIQSIIFFNQQMNIAFEFCFDTKTKGKRYLPQVSTMKF